MDNVTEHRNNRNKLSNREKKAYGVFENRLESTHQMAEKPLVQVLYIEEERCELRFDHTRYVYVDIRAMQTLGAARQVLYQLQMAGYYPIIMYPEQCDVLLSNNSPFYRIARRGGIGMVDAASVTGAYGKRTRDIALNLLQGSLSPLIGSSAEEAFQEDSLKNAYMEIEKWMGTQNADMIRENRRRVENDEYIQLDQPSRSNYMKRRSSWSLLS
ncbi:hypothetical protein ATL39_0533 [Sinobaca qinghaiensis]|uniref:protein-tyrosine-phosphatase n=1 Tax=Sinobaca qinghaiensis TaxID=342944 RepID=A0A419V8D4_9BACL|nr:CpsB/CapC family capsule biosynthesis tyrosine phosphatase [Sinobaca qinghaiensis]RKD76317.1 hypothetical protein ATL39_0533 [Sinobaca qinghaiensis]